MVSADAGRAGCAQGGYQIGDVVATDASTIMRGDMTSPRRRLPLP
jgi:hypothetical protein